MNLPPFESIRVNGVTLRAVVTGNPEGPLCVLVHGWPESWYSWRHQIGPLVARGYRVCVPDVRGYGGSDKPHAIEAYDMESMMGDVVGLIDALSAQPAILIGHDWGAPIVWQTAIVHRERVRAIVGLSVPHLGRGPMPSVTLFRALYRERFFYQLYFQEPGIAEREFEADVRTALLRTYCAGSGEYVGTLSAFADKPKTARFLDGMPNPTTPPAWLSESDLAYYTQEFERSGFRGPLNRYRNSERDFAALPELANAHVTQPALFIVGDRDPVLRFVPGVDLLAAMRGFYDDLRETVVLKGIGHWTQQEDPDGVNRALLSFLDGL